MKTKILLFNILLLTFCNVLAQNSKSVVDIEKFTRDRIYSGNGNTRGGEVDSLKLESGKTYVFKQTPLIYFDGYSKLFSDYGAVTLIQFGGKGYQCYWIVRKDTLYLEKVILNGTDYKREDTLEQEMQDILIGRIASLTGVEVNEDGMIPATWMTGWFGCCAMKPDDFGEDSFSPDWDNEEVLTLKKGKLEKIRQVKKEYIDVYTAEGYEYPF